MYFSVHNFGADITVFGGDSEGTVHVIQDGLRRFRWGIQAGPVSRRVPNN